MTGARRFRGDPYLKSCTARVVAVSARGIEPDRTVFAPRGGGQPGDTGRLHRADGVAVRIVDARPGEEPATVVHVPAPDAPALAVGDLVTAELDGGTVATPTGVSTPPCTYCPAWSWRR